MKFDKDDAGLAATAMVSGGFGLGFLVAPMILEKTMMTKTTTMDSWGGKDRGFCAGIAMVTLAARDAALMSNKDATPKTKKRANVVNGIAFAGWALYSLKNTQDGSFNKAAGYSNSAVCAGVSALNLYQGLKKNDTGNASEKKERK